MKLKIELQNKNKLWILAIILIIMAVLSASIVTKYTTSPENHAHTIASLDEKKATVMELTAASAGISAAITAIPGDTGNTLAEKMMDLSSYFLVILCAIFLEKYLVTITGYAAFRILIPIACILLAIWCFCKKEVLIRLAVKALLFGIAIYLVVPMSVTLSDMIENTYQASIDSTIQSARASTKDIEQSTESSDDKSSNILSGIISKVKDGVTGITDKVGEILNNFIEAVAVLIVTSCIIPILVLIFFAWLIKSILGINIGMPKMLGVRKNKSNPEEKTA